MQNKKILNLLFCNVISILTIASNGWRGFTKVMETTAKKKSLIPGHH